LGSPIKPAVDGCEATLVTNSIAIDKTNTEYEKAKIEFEKILYNSTKQESDSDSFLIEENKEEKMETEIIKNAASDSSSDPIENATQEVTTRISVSTDTYNYDDNGQYVGDSYESHTVSTTEIREVPESEVKSAENSSINNTEAVTNSDTD